MKLHWGKLSNLEKFAALGIVALIICIIMTPLFPGAFTTPEAAQSGTRWIIAIFGVVFGLIFFSMFRDIVRPYASEGKVRVIFMDHSQLTEDIEGEYPNLAYARDAVRKQYDLRRIQGIFLFYNDRGELLLKVMP